MKVKILESFDEAVADIPDGASIMMFFWGVAGTPQNLIRAIRDRGLRNLTIITHNFVPGWIGSHVCTEDEMMTPFFLLKQGKKLISAWPRPIEAAAEMGRYIE